MTRRDRTEESDEVVKKKKSKKSSKHGPRPRVRMSYAKTVFHGVKPKKHAAGYVLVVTLIMTRDGGVHTCYDVARTTGERSFVAVGLHY